MNKAKFTVLIPCAGTGLRFGRELPKQYTLVEDKSVLEHTLMAFLAVARVNQIVIIASPADGYIDRYASLSPKITIHKIGGATRAETVLNGLKQLEGAADDLGVV